MIVNALSDIDFPSVFIRLYNIDDEAHGEVTKLSILRVSKSICELPKSHCLDHTPRLKDLQRLLRQVLVQQKPLQPDQLRDLQRRRHHLRHSHASDDLHVQEPLFVQEVPLPATLATNAGE